MRNFRLLWHIFPAIVGITLATLILLSWYGTHAIRDFFYQQMGQDVVARATLLQPEIDRLLQKDPQELQAFCRRTGRQAATRITLIAGDGTVLADSDESPAQMENHAQRPEVQSALNNLQTGTAVRYSKTLGHNRLYVALPAMRDASGRITVLRLSLPASDIDRALRRIQLRIIGMAALIVLLASFAAYSVARRISLPISTLQRKAEKLAKGEPLHPFDISDFRVSSEMASLATSFNTMTREVQHRIHVITRQNNELEAVFSSMMEPVMAIDTEEQIIRINRASATLFRLNQNKTVGQSFPGLIRNQELQALVSQVLETNETVQEEISVFEATQEKRLRTRVTPLLDATDNPIGVLVVMNDMSRLNRLENLRREFVANVSHELKTPITSIKGYVETLLDGALDDREDAVRFLQIISRQTGRLNSIVDDLLTLSRIEQQNKEIPMAPGPVRRVLESAVQACGLQAQDKKMRIALDCPPDLRGLLNAPLLEQAVINLLTNAITYSPEASEINITAGLRTDENRKQVLAIQVRDSGPGIEIRHQERIFERFYRCDKARSRENGGTGLGLAIVKHIAQSHGGAVTVESAPGQGSTFSILLPVA